MTLKVCTENPPSYVPKTGESHLPVAVSLSKTYDLGPDGISFNKPVTITLPFDKALLEENADSSRIGIFYYNGQHWVFAGGLVDRQKGTVTVTLKSFPGLVVEIALGTAIAAIYYQVYKKAAPHIESDPIAQGNVSKHVVTNDPNIVKYASSSGVVNYDGRVPKWIPLEDPAKPGQINPEFIDHLNNTPLTSLDRIAFERDRIGFTFPSYNATEDKFQWFKPAEFFDKNNLADDGEPIGDCTSISSAYLSIFRKLGIEAYGVDGYKSDLAGGKRHAWVEFYLDGEVYYYDNEEGIKRLKDVESKLTRPTDIKGEGYMWNEKGQKKYVKKWWESIKPGITPSASTGAAKTTAPTTAPSTSTGAAKTTAPATVLKDMTWVFTEIVNFENKESWAASANDYWKFEHSYAPGNFMARTWHKDEKDYIAYGTSAVWSAPPKVIKSGEKVSMTATLSETENTHKWNTSAAATWADFAPPQLGPGSRGRVAFQTAGGATDISINGAHKASASDTFTAVAPAGSPGERIAIRQIYYMGNTMATYYIYEWKAN